MIWRQTSFDAAAGSVFVSRLHTGVSSLNLQERNVLDFLIESVSAARSGAIRLLFYPLELLPLESF